MGMVPGDMLTVAVEDGEKIAEQRDAAADALSDAQATIRTLTRELKAAQDAAEKPKATKAAAAKVSA